MGYENVGQKEKKLGEEVRKILIADRRGKNMLPEDEGREKNGHRRK